MGRYVNGVHRYTPGRELGPADPAEFAGVRIPPMTPHNAGHLSDLKGRRHKPPELDASEILDFAAFRSGFGPRDDYLALTGLSGATD